MVALNAFVAGILGHDYCWFGIIAGRHSWSGVGLCYVVVVLSCVLRWMMWLLCVLVCCGG